MRPEPPAPGAASGGFALLRQPVFGLLWTATVLGNVASFMRDVVSSWMVTELSASPTAVALIQTAATLPIFLLSIPAGVLADILDRRRLLIALQLLLAGVSLALMLLARAQALTVGWLIGLTFLGGVGAALMGPTWQSIVPDLVARAALRDAVALNSLGINVSRALGPALGGFLLVSFGASLTYGVDVLGYGVVVAALLWWRRPVAAESALQEHFFGALRAGLRYARSSPALRIVLLRSAMFFSFASVVWALLPLVARHTPGGSAGFYGLMLGGVGAGAILGAMLLPRLRRRMEADGLLLLASLVAALVTAALALAPPRWLGLLLMLLLGLGWIVALTTLNGVAQAVLPNWVRGRGLAIYLTVFNGAMAGASLAWGLVAQQLGVPVTLFAGAAGLALAGLLLHRIKLPRGDAELTPSNHWPEPLLSAPMAHDRGPVLVQVDYRVRQQDRPAFLAVLGQLSHQRRRDGAYAWGLTEDTRDPERLLEWFLLESWAEHLRQHQRVSVADAALQAAAHRFHVGPGQPAVSHFLALDMAGAVSHTPTEKELS